MIIEDEASWRWLVEANDPAAKLCSTLVRKGWHRIVLPRHTIQTGQVTAILPPVEELERMAEQYQSSASLLPEDARQVLADNFLRQMALWESCVAAYGLVD